jgi:hypothetical protein
MTAILRQLPFQEAEGEVHVELERIPVKPYQIVVWVSVTPRTVLDLPPNAPRIPAILDTGHSHNISIQRRHLAEWARVEEGALPPLGQIRQRDRLAPLRAAHLWIHPNVPGKRDEWSGAPALRLGLDRGIAVYPGDGDFPRLPLLGLRALVRNRLHFTVDSERRLVNLRTPDWRTKVMRWFS